MSWRAPNTPVHGGGGGGFGTGGSFNDGFSFGSTIPSNYRTPTSTTTPFRYGGSQQPLQSQQTPSFASERSSVGREMTSSGEYGTSGHEPSQRFLPSVFAPSPTHSQLEPTTPNLRASQQRAGRSDQFSDLFYDDFNPTSTPITTPSATSSHRKNLDYSPGFGHDQLRGSSSGLKVSSTIGGGGGGGGGMLPLPGVSLYDLEEFEPPATDMTGLPPSRSGGDQFKPLSPLSVTSPSLSAIPPSSTIPNSMAIITPPLRNEAGMSEKDERWVTVFGFPAGQTSVILRHFQNYGTIINHQPSPMNANWVHIQYQTIQQARNALGKNGKLVDSYMIGVCDCNDEIAFHRGGGGGGEVMKKKPVLHPDYYVEPSDLIRRIPQPRNSIWSLFLEYVFGI